MYNGLNWTLALQSGSTSVWDLIFSGASTADTQASLANQSRRLRSTFNSTMASANFANMNTYDCNLFDKNNMCISAGGRYTSIDNPSSNNSAAVVVLGYKVSPNIRIGGFLDQSVNHNMPTGVDMSNKNPMMGAFAVWNHQADGLGFQMKLANAYLDKDVTTSRAIIGTSEAGRGRTDLNTQSYVGELSYAFQYQDSTIVRPYFAVRYTNIKQDGYTEDTTAAVTSPLTYAKLSDRSTTALMGVKLNHALTPRTNLTASLGVEQDVNHKTDQLTASGVAGLTSENFNNNIKRTRPVASAGAYYAVAKNQRLSGEVYYQQLPFQSTGSATAYVNYMIGF
ncbi:autotransporter outer membrane beta-barrel domain-containing protein [Candidatus Methylopumilus universalis]|nr:autotransporter outer membrane beta-barrel domain-containing protein [Candidatus Methylopumilus universalis]